MPTRTAERHRWWIAYPKRLQHERDALASAGARARIVTPRDETPDLLRAHVTWPHQGEQLKLTVEFPPRYPWVPPTVLRKHRRHMRHADPVTGELCLLSDPGNQWHPEMTVAQLLSEQIPKVFDSENGPTRGEAYEPVPASNWLRNTVSAMSLLIDSTNAPTTGSHGHLDLIVRDGLLGHTILAAIFPPHLPDNRPWIDWPDKHTLQAPWFELDRRLTPRDTARALWRQFMPANSKSPMMLVRFRDEVSYRSIGWSWLSILKAQSETGRSVYGWTIGRPAGRRDLNVRIPEPSATQSAMIIGVGAIGYHVAILLARANIDSMLLVDPGLVNPATASRQYGIKHADVPKVVAAHTAISSINPHVQLSLHAANFGTTASQSIIEEQMPHTDIIIDCAAETATTRLITNLAERLNKPVISAAATNGGLGGWITYLPANSPTCWACIELHKNDGTIPAPPEAPERNARGCHGGTYQAAAHDLTPIAALTVQTCLRPGEVPAHSVMSTPVTSELPPSPNWEHVIPSRHDDCPRHVSKHHDD